MVQNPTPSTTEQVAAVAAKLQAFFETLDADERLILQAYLLELCGNATAAQCLLLSTLDRLRQASIPPLALGPLSRSESRW